MGRPSALRLYRASWPYMIQGHEHRYKRIDGFPISLGSYLGLGPDPHLPATPDADPSRRICAKSLRKNFRGLALRAFCRVPASLMILQPPSLDVSEVKPLKPHEPWSRRLTYSLVALYWAAP